jgi:hypothetical protein
VNPTLADGDANGDGAVDGADLAVWQGQYGTVPESSAINVAESLSTEAATSREPATAEIVLWGLDGLAFNNFTPDLSVASRPAAKILVEDSWIAKVAAAKASTRHESYPLAAAGHNLEQEILVTPRQQIANSETSLDEAFETLLSNNDF